MLDRPDHPDHRDPLGFFSPPTAAWFRATFGTPTPPQAQGWPAIARGDHALILSPTGSGKTLTAFLWSLDALFRELCETPEPEPRRGGRRISSAGIGTYRYPEREGTVPLPVGYPLPTVGNAVARW
jgi:hypothetical protein